MSIGVLTWPGETQLTVMPVRPEGPREPAAQRGHAALGRGVRHGAAEAAGPPALRAEQDDPPALALASIIALPRCARQEERGLEVDVVLEVPVLLGHLVERCRGGAARRPGWRGRRGCRAPDAPASTSGAWRRRGRAGRRRRRRGPLPSRPADHLVDGDLVQVDGQDLRAGRREASATALPMPPAAPVTMTPLPSRPAPTLQVIARPSSSMRARPPRLGSARHLARCR